MVLVDWEQNNELVTYLLTYLRCPQLERLKSDLRDVLYSHKWTPDAYLLAKAYIAEDDKKDDSDSGSKSSLPKIALKNQTRKL